MNPQAYELLMERLFAAGALDVWLTPILMKKGRPATQVSALAPSRSSPRDRGRADPQQHDTRCPIVPRSNAPKRRAASRPVTTRWGDVRVKLRGWDGRVIGAAPEYDDCASLARIADIPFREIWNEAHRFAEVYVGRKIDDAGNLT